MQLTEFDCTSFFVAQKKPSSILSTLGEYLVKLYFPSWFEIKGKTRLLMGCLTFSILLNK